MSDKDPDWFQNVEFRPHPREGLVWLTPMFSVSNVEKARNFYRDAFGFVPIFELSDEAGELFFVRMRYRGSNITLNREKFDFEAVSPETSGQLPPFTMDVYVDDVTQSFERALREGAVVLFAPREEFWGDLRARVRCPFGYVWNLAQKKID